MMMDARSDSQVSGMEMLNELKGIYHHCGKLYDLIKQSGAIKADAPLTDKVTYSLTASAHLRAMKDMMEEIHHGLGHAYFGVCWKGVEIGEEESADPSEMAKQMVQQFLESLGAESGIDVKAHVIGSEADIPDEAPEAVKDKLKELLSNAKKAENHKDN